ncbi:unnamed protein product [Lactuca saligna]|uniref:Uncharacterized protein n=1 Tax=Lactuca saligna TaxID=75948 RepID=A0AA35UVY0_LACSI|nr:unnamed protein product [Lactuca saligna]
MKKLYKGEILFHKVTSQRSKVWYPLLVLDYLYRIDLTYSPAGHSTSVYTRHRRLHFRPQQQAILSQKRDKFHENFGGKMELIKLSKFKLQLQTLITEVRELREKERASSNQLHDYVQKQKQSDEEFSIKIKELETELTSSNELQQKLERKVQFLEDENYLLENKHKELKETISSILQEKEDFVKAYQESTCEMKRSIESRDRKISILSEKINAHLISFHTIHKEALVVKQVVDNATHVVNEKEEVVSQLKMKLDKVCAFEKLFIEKIKDLETKLKIKESEFHKKDRTLQSLNKHHLQETIQMKEGIIETLISENKALHSEVGMLVVTVRKIQDTIARMDEEDKETNVATSHHIDSRATVSELDSECSTTQEGIC